MLVDVVTCEVESLFLGLTRGSSVGGGFSLNVTVPASVEPSLLLVVLSDSRCPLPSSTSGTIWYLIERWTVFASKDQLP